MDWTVNCLLFSLFLALSCANCDVIVVDAVPAEVNTEPAVVLDKDRTGNEPITYDGAQLWRIAYGDQEHKNAVMELQKQFQVSIWNLHKSNATEPSVDMFVKSAMVNDARSFLESARVPFDVVINDVQDAINSENPSLDDVEHWQNRNGELY
jgi:Carboxypeptidase activation peptide